MHRQPFLRDLEDYGRRHPGERETVSRFAAFVRANADCFERSSLAGHVTGSAWVVDGKGERALLTHHRKLGRWLQPGGHVDGESDVLAAAAREAFEETGLPDLKPAIGGLFDIDIHPIPATPKEPAHFHYDARYALRATGSEAFVVSGESLELAWAPIREMDFWTREESVLRMARKWLEANP